MRLIDADALKEATEAHGERIAYVVSFLWDVDAAPTIPAIPVKWLRQEARKDGGLINSVIRGLIMKWQKERYDNEHGSVEG